MEELKYRLDILLVSRGIFASRERARENIINGNIYVNGKKVTKCGNKFDDNIIIEFKGEDIPFVSRGGLKLQKALEKFQIDLHNKICLDIGASTGGFTDCMLQHGGTKVYAIDVGTEQLHLKLKEDPRVISMEKTNIKDVTSEQLKELCDFATIDVSFISLEKVLPNILDLLKEKGEIIALIKPQFQAGKSNLNKKGVVKNLKVHKKVLYELQEYFLLQLNLSILNLAYSPIKGPNGNIEYLVHLTKDKQAKSHYRQENIDNIVNEAYNLLN